MAEGRAMGVGLREVVSQIRQSVAGEGERSDRELLSAHARGDGAAFAELTRRHGPLVWHVCRRALAVREDAEDAVQATFLVLARKAEAVAWRESIAPWLYAVARRVSLQLRARLAPRPTPPPEAR